MYALYLNIHRLGQPEELLPLMRPYFLILLTSLPFVLWFNAFKQFTDGITDTRVSMWILLGGNVLNIVGNYLLIYGKCGLPELGLAGAGLSTLTARILMFIAYLYLFFCTGRYRKFHKGFSSGKSTVQIFSCSTVWDGPSQDKWGWKRPLSASAPSW